MFFIISKIATFFLLPLTWIIGLLFWSFLTRHPRWRRRSRRIALLFIVIFSNPYLSFRAIALLEPAPQSIDKVYDVGIVLSGMLENGIMVKDQVQFQQSADRLTEAVRLYHAGKIKKLLISGGTADIQHPQAHEGEALVQMAIGLGVDKEDILKEMEARNTYQNALYSTQILKIHPGDFLLITSAFHIPRASRCFEKQGLKPSVYPVDYRAPEGFRWAYLVPNSAALDNWNIFFKEVVGLVVYRLVGYC